MKLSHGKLANSTDGRCAARPDASRFRWRAVITVCVACGLLAALGTGDSSQSALGADDPPSSAPAPAPGSAAPAAPANPAVPGAPAPPAGNQSAAGNQPTAIQPGNLSEAEGSLGRRYRQFEQVLLQMAEYLRKTEPERADLLIRAHGKSQEDRVASQMERILELLKNEQLGDAIGSEEHLVANLKSLLELLQSEDRRHALEEEKKWIESLHKEVGKLSVREKELRRMTEGRNKLGPLSQRQGEIGRDAKALVEKIDKNDAAKNAASKHHASNKPSSEDRGDKNKPDRQNPDGSAEPKDGSGKPQDSPKSDDKQNPDSKPSDPSKKGDKNQSPNKKGKEGSPQGKSQGPPQKPSGEQGAQGNGEEQQEGAPSESENEPQKAQRQTPGRKEIEQARRAMQQAEEELKRLRAEKALERQDEAVRKLAEAQAQLEKILRQLREEEQKIMLTSLEARFAKMLLMQIQLQTDTINLARTQKNAWTARHFGRARELSVQEESIAAEADKALTLLKEEGSSVAFPKGVEQVRDDMLNIARRLGKNDVGELTQSIEKDVIEALEELVTALQAEIENRKKPDAQKQRGRPSHGEEEDKQLVEKIAELKMLRSLQLRVNRRTKQIGHLIQGEQATSDDLAAQLQALARRQAEIQEATYILASGRNQ